MISLNLLQVLIIAAALAAAVGLALFWWRYRRRQSPAEKEKSRRLDVNNSGRLTDGVLVESPYGQAPSQNAELLFYRYTASGVEYTAAQDVSTLSDRIPSEVCRPGQHTAVKYDPRRPSNSIVVCEEWSGLRQDTAEVVRAH